MVDGIPSQPKDALVAALVCFTALNPSLGSPVAAAEQVTVLTAGSVIERAMARGETHHYQIGLQEGEYFQATVEQRGVDVTQTVIGPDGGTVLETDSPSADNGPDALAFVAATSGPYSLTLRVGGRISPAATYVLNVEAVRAPTSTDLLRVRTVRANAEGARLVKAGEEGQAGQALELFRQCARGWQELGERRLQMWTENFIGYLFGEHLDRYGEALEHYQRALSAAREVGDAFAEAYFLANVGLIYRRQGLFDEARTSLDQALQLHRAAGRRDREAYVLTALGSLFNTSGELQQGIDCLQEALRLYHQTGDARNEAVVRTNLGAAYLRLGEYESALEQYRLALPGFEKEQRFRASSMTQMAIAHSALGDREAARAFLEDALSTYRAIENRAMEASTSVTLGTLDREEGKLESALKRHQDALGVLEASGDRILEARAQCELGETARLLGDRRAARVAFEAALALLPQPGAFEALCAERGLGELARDEGDLDRARAHVERALETVESLRGSLASQRARASTLARHQALYELLIDLRMRQRESEPTAGHDVAALEVAERARARSLLELLSEAHIDVRQGVDRALLDQERSLRHRLNARADAQAQALAAKKTERAETLSREVMSLTAELADVEARIRRASPSYAALTQPRPLSVAEIQREVLDEDTLLLEYALGETTSYLWVVSPKEVRSYKLAPRAEIEAAARAVYERLAAPSGSAAPDTGYLRQAVALSRLVLGPAADALGDSRLLVVAAGMLQYVPFGALPDPRSLGVAATAAGGATTAGPLLARQEVVTAPSASVVAVVRREAAERQLGPRMAAVLADPVYEATDPRVKRREARLAPGPKAAPAVTAEALPLPLDRALRSVHGSADRSRLTRLPFSRREADAIASFAPPGDVHRALGFDASRETALSPELANYRIVHLAAHGLLDAQRPELSGIVLSLLDERGHPRDGFLRLHDIFNLRLGADLVVLSGCQTGLGRAVQGEGLIGLTRGFMYAGARRVVASLWRVDDESTAELMKRFYRALLEEGRRPADALRTAQIQMSRERRWSAPFYWAGFVLQGEWR